MEAEWPKLVETCLNNHRVSKKLFAARANEINEQENLIPEPLNPTRWFSQLRSWKTVSKGHLRLFELTLLDLTSETVILSATTDDRPDPTAHRIFRDLEILQAMQRSSLLAAEIPITGQQCQTSYEIVRLLFQFLHDKKGNELLLLNRRSLPLDNLFLVGLLAALRIKFGEDECSEDELRSEVERLVRPLRGVPDEQEPVRVGELTDDVVDWLARTIKIVALRESAFQVPQPLERLGGDGIPLPYENPLYEFNLKNPVSFFVFVTSARESSSPEAFYSVTIDSFGRLRGKDATMTLARFKIAEAWSISDERKKENRWTPPDPFQRLPINRESLDRLVEKIKIKGILFDQCISTSHVPSPPR